MQSPHKAIIAAAGYGTRMLPITKAIDKCMMPLLNRPVIDYAVQDLIKAGVKDIYFVVSEGSSQLQSYYGREHELEKYLKEQGKAELIGAIIPPTDVNFHYVVQKRSDSRYGTAIPLWLCREFIKKNEQFYLVMGDQTLWRADGRSEAELLFESVKNADAKGGLIGVEIPMEDAEKYGIIAMDGQGTFQNIIEKPAPGKAPSNLLNASFYLLPGEIIEYLKKYIDVGVEGEYWFIDVLNGYAGDGFKMYVQRSNATYMDCGSVEPWVMANEFLLEYGPRQ